MSKYALTNEDEGTPAAVEAIRQAGPLAGLSGVAASNAYIEMHQGETKKLSDIFAEMVTMGFEGSENAVAVAFADLAREDAIQRPRRGHYVLAPVDDDAEVPVRRQPSVFDSLGIRPSSPSAFSIARRTGGSAG